MAEYAKRKSDFQEVWIGSCDTLKGIRYEDRFKVRKADFSIDPSRVKNCRWRIPFPDEDDVKIGDYKDMDRMCYLVGYPVSNLEKSTGIIQLRHPSGLLINVTCYHGEKLPEGNADFTPFWNGFDSHQIGLKFVKNTDEGMRAIIGCRHCMSMWNVSMESVLPYIKDAELKRRLEAYNENSTRISQTL